MILFNSKSLKILYSIYFVNNLLNIIIIFTRLFNTSLN